jgi:hypothetical protein
LVKMSEGGGGGSCARELQGKTVDSVRLIEKDNP